MVTIDMNKKPHLTLLITASMLFACTQEEVTVCRNVAPGFLITNVEIIDGSGAPAFAGSVRINDGLIADIGDLEIRTVTPMAASLITRTHWSSSARALRQSSSARMVDLPTP